MVTYHYILPNNGSDGYHGIESLPDNGCHGINTESHHRDSITRTLYHGWPEHLSEVAGCGGQYDPVSRYYPIITREGDVA